MLEGSLLRVDVSVGEFEGLLLSIGMSLFDGELEGTWVGS